MEETVSKFDAYFASNYNKIRQSMERYSSAKLNGFDEDIFQETYLKVREKIEKEGIADDSDSGLLNYFFKAFKTNMLREGQYARNKKVDDNIAQENLLEIYESWYDKNNISSKEKLLSDLRKDFYTLKIAEVVELNFDAEHFYLWRLKVFLGYTYKQLAEKTKIPSVRNKVLEVYDYLRQNVKKEDLERAFNEAFSEIIDF